tara:strand:- start:66 stop:668 length:603 start_codon:yes stop_codon:yes gene_type:complete
LKQIELDISAIRQSDSQNNAYVLLLNEINGNRQLPIVIGWCEARAIAIGLEEKEKVTRPLTHDLFKTFGDKFKIKIEKVIIHTLIEGIFHASFHCENINTGEKDTIDARTSDAIAIAIRYKCPIFTYEDILDRAGIIINAGKTQIINISLKKEKTKNPEESSIKSFSVSKLKKLLEQAIEKEDYETASKIRDEINSRENK